MVDLFMAGPSVGFCNAAKEGIKLGLRPEVVFDAGGTRLGRRTPENTDARHQRISIPARGQTFSRSAERRVGKECVSTCRSRWSPSHLKKKPTIQHKQYTRDQRQEN